MFWTRKAIPCSLSIKTISGGCLDLTSKTLVSSYAPRKVLRFAELIASLTDDFIDSHSMNLQYAWLKFEASPRKIVAILFPKDQACLTAVRYTLSELNEEIEQKFKPGILGVDVSYLVPGEFPQIANPGPHHGCFVRIFDGSKPGKNRWTPRLELGDF